MIDKIKLAFLDVRNDLAPDVIIADPHLNKLFIKACQARGLSDSVSSLNIALLNARRNSHLTGLPKSKRTIVRNQDEYIFASEMAVRFLERRDQVSLDAILCDPKRAKEFDKIAMKLAPGFSSFEYRWAALGLRKRRRLRPEMLVRVVKPKSMNQSSVKDLVINDIPPLSGLYVFYISNCALYVGETENLRKRIG
jgi:site-specific DNA-methyltransferase (adenine-specific)